MRKEPYFPSQSKLVRTSSGVNGNKIESFCGKYNSNVANLDWSSFPCEKFHDVLYISSRRIFAISPWNNLLKSKSVYELRIVESVICDRLKKTPRVTATKLCESQRKVH